MTSPTPPQRHHVVCHVKTAPLLNGSRAEHLNAARKALLKLAQAADEVLLGACRLYNTMEDKWPSLRVRVAEHAAKERLKWDALPVGGDPLSSEGAVCAAGSEPVDGAVQVFPHAPEAA